MKRFIAVVAATAALVWFSTPADAGGRPPGDRVASTSSSPAARPTQRWSAWVPSPTTAFDLTGICTETVHLAPVADQVRVRSRLIPGGNTEIESKGRLVVALTPESQPTHHYRFDISGPSLGKHSQIQYTNGDYLFRSTGASLAYFAGTSVDGTGLPRLAYVKGAYANLFNDATRADIITRPGKVVDVCRYLGLDSAP